jgi:hypothetical protein
MSNRGLEVLMSRHLCTAGLVLILTAVSCFFSVSDGSTPNAHARRSFRQNLASASSIWNSVELECPSPGCANNVKACWTEAGVKYVFSGLCRPKSIGGGIVSVYAASSYRAGTGPAIVTYCFMSDRSPTKVIVAEGVEADMGWAAPRAREFFYATPANG